MLLEKLSEKRLIGKVQCFSNLLDLHIRILQQHAQFAGHITVDPLVRRTLAHLFDGFRQIFRRDAELLCIPADTALAAEIGFEQMDKLCEELAAAQHTVLGWLARVIDQVAQIVEHGKQKGGD